MSDARFGWLVRLFLIIGTLCSALWFVGRPLWTPCAQRHNPPSASHEQHEPRRPRRLLLHRREIDKIEIKLEEKGFSMPALRLYWKEKRVKVELGLGRGKAQYDKRHTLKKKVQDREAKREVARFNRS